MDKQSQAQFRTYVFWLGLLSTIPVGVVWGAIVPHPGDPPNIFTLVGELSILLLFIATIKNIGNSTSEAWRCAGSFALACYCTVIMFTDPFLSQKWEGQISTIGWLLPVFVIDIWFTWQRFRLGAIAAGIFICNSVGLATFNILCSDPASFSHKIRT